MYTCQGDLVCSQRDNIEHFTATTGGSGSTSTTGGSGTKSVEERLKALENEAFTKISFDTNTSVLNLKNASGNKNINVSLSTLKGKNGSTGSTGPRGPAGPTGPAIKEITTSGNKLKFTMTDNTTKEVALNLKLQGGTPVYF